MNLLGIGLLIGSLVVAGCPLTQSVASASPPPPSVIETLNGLPSGPLGPSSPIKVGAEHNSELWQLPVDTHFGMFADSWNELSTIIEATAEDGEVVGTAIFMPSTTHPLPGIVDLAQPGPNGSPAVGISSVSVVTGSVVSTSSSSPSLSVAYVVFTFAGVADQANPAMLIPMAVGPVGTDFSASAALMSGTLAAATQTPPAFLPSGLFDPSTCQGSWPAPQQISFTQCASTAACAALDCVHEAGVRYVAAAAAAYLCMSFALSKCVKNPIAWVGWKVCLAIAGATVTACLATLLWATWDLADARAQCEQDYGRDLAICKLRFPNG
jgi:hypothetical protein